jgi:hypothetical protein
MSAAPIEVNDRELRMKFPYPHNAKHPEHAGEKCYLEIHDADPDSMVGGNQNIIACSEYGLEGMAGFLDYVRPILRENNGLLLLNGTVRGKNHLWHLYNKVKDRPDWHVSYLTAETAVRADGSRIITEQDILDEISQGMDPALARQEFGNLWDTPSPGAFYADQMFELYDKGQVGVVPFDPMKEVHTGWDLGIADATVIWFMQENAYGGMNLIDYEAGSGHGLPHWLGLLRAGKRAKYTYGYHFFPHDVMKTKSSSDGKLFTDAQVAAGLGYYPTVIETGPNVVKQGISQVANLLPLCWFDSSACENGLEALKHYSSNPTKFFFGDGRIRYDGKPIHNQYSDPADAFRMLSLGFNTYIRPNQLIVKTGRQGKKLGVKW